MRIGLLADTHDRVPAVAELTRRFREARAELVLHAGDVCAPFALAPLHEAGIRLVGVYGRNDGDHAGLAAAAAALPAGGEMFDGPHALELGGTSILLVHELADAPERSLEAHTVIVHGCSHRPEMKERGRALLVNPGEACGWLTGTPSAAILDLHARRVEFLSLTGPEWRT